MSNLLKLVSNTINNVKFVKTFVQYQVYNFLQIQYE
jgi:hypothetical protein